MQRFQALHALSQECEDESISRPPTLEKKGSAAPSEVRKSKRRAKDYTPHVDAFVLCMGAIIFVLAARWLGWFAS